MMNIINKIVYETLHFNTAKQLSRILIEKKLTVSTAESCTGGLIASRITDISGSSEYFKESYVTYANDVKHKILGVSEDTLKKFGAVSKECAFEMAKGLEQITGCDISICTTGIAGPTGGSLEKPVGLVYVSICHCGEISVKEFRFNPNTERTLMKFKFSEAALRMALDILKN